MTHTVRFLILLSVFANASRHCPGAESDFHEFVLRQLNRSSLSANAADFGQPMLPLYSDAFAGGTYGFPDAPSAGVTEDDNDPDRASGASSVRMTWNGTGANGWIQFDIAKGAANRPRELAAFGFARRVRFQARGDIAGRRLKLLVFRVNGSGHALLASGWFTLNNTWADYTLAIAATRPKDLHAVQFLMDSTNDPGGGTVRLDEVRLGTDGFDPLRVPQSYEAKNAPTGSIATTAAGRDLSVYPNRSFLYDCALTIIELIEKGDTVSARQVADALIAGALSDGSYENQRNAGHVLLGTGAVRPPLSPVRTLGDNAWFGLALVSLHAATGDRSYLTRARAISDWAETNLKVSSADSRLEGYRGGYDETGSAVLWRSTEHNIDHAQFNRRLAHALTAIGDSGAPACAARAGHAAAFVLAMFNPIDGHFWTGTGNDDAINMSSIPLDAQLWPLLTIAQWPEHAAALDWSRPLLWARTHLTVTDGAFTGLKYSSAMTDAVWFEGNAIAALGCGALGQTAHEAAYLALLEAARQTGPNADGSGLIASSSDDTQDASLGAVYDARLALAPSAWAVFALRGTNPFAPPGGLIWQQQGQIAVVNADAVDTAEAITILRNGEPVTMGDQLVLSFDANPAAPEDDRQALVIDTNGMLRLRHLDGKTSPALADKFGTSMRLPPGLITDDGGTEYYLGVRVETMNLITSGAAGGVLVIDLTGVPVNAAGAAAPVTVHWRLALLPPRNKATEARLLTEVTAASTFHLSPAHLANAEAFRAAVFSSSYVPATNTTIGRITHDADQLRVTSANGGQLLAMNLGLAPANQLFISGGLSFDGHLELNQVKPAPLNTDPPSIFIEMLPGGDSAVYRAQGYKTVDGGVNENSDNLGAWASRDFGGNTVASGTQFAWSQRIVAYDRGPLLPLEAFAGRYFGVFTQPPSAFAEMGSLQITVAAGGTFTARLVRGSSRHAFGGTFDSLGHSVRTIGAAPATLTVTLDLDLTGGSDQITGTILSGAGSVPVTVDRNVWTPTRKCGLAGIYNLTFGPGSTPGSPLGAGWARLTVSTRGSASVAGALADGAAFSNAAPLSRTGGWPMHIPLYGNQGALSGRLTFTHIAGVGDATGTLAWSKPTAFTTTTSAAASRYAPPAANLRILTGFDTSGGIGTLDLGTVTNTLTISTKNLVTFAPPNASHIRLTITPALGQFTGTFLHPVSFKTVSFKGVFIPEQQRGAGFLSGPSGSEMVEFTPGP